MRESKGVNNLNKQKIVLTCMAALCIISLIAMAAALATPRTAVGEFVPPPFADSAVQGVPTVPDGLGWQVLDAKAYQVGICGKIVPNGTHADVWFYNPADNSVWLKLRITDKEGNVLGETGIIRQGEYLQSVKFTDLPSAGTAITLKIMAYQPDTYHSEGVVSLNTVISPSIGN